MELVNADVPCTVIAKNPGDRKWYRWWAFPLVPMFEYRPGDDWNAPDFNLSWLNVSMWSMMSPDIGFEIMLEDVGLYAKIRLPYLIICIWFLRFPFSWHQKLWRVGRLNRQSMRDEVKR